MDHADGDQEVHDHDQRCPTHEGAGQEEQALKPAM